MSESIVAAARCLLCGRATYDPGKGERPWSRGMTKGRQVLICPECQGRHPDWADSLDRCERCGSTRLSLTLGESLCRQCGRVQGSVATDDLPLDF